VEAKASGSDSSSFSDKVNGDSQWGSDNGDANRLTGGYSLVFALTVLQVCIFLSYNRRFLFALWTLFTGLEVCLV
jgi:hypothetical protein